MHAYFKRLRRCESNRGWPFALLTGLFVGLLTILEGGVARHPDAGMGTGSC